MVADKKDANSYIAEMGSETRPIDPDTDVDDAVASLVADIEAEFTKERLNEFVRAGGFTPDTGEPDGSPTEESS